MANPAYRKRIYANEGVTISSSEVELVAETDADAGRGPYGRITGVARSTNAVTIRIYWGWESGTYDSLTTIDVPADAAAGVVIDEHIPAQYFKIVAVRATGSDSTDFRAGLYLRAGL